MNTTPSPHAPILLPCADHSPALGFHPSEGFALTLVDFPGGGLRLTAYAEHRPTVPEFLGCGWHLPLDRIVADFRRGAGAATLFLGARSYPLRQTGWRGTEEVEFEGPQIHCARFHPRDRRWIVEHPDGQTSVFAACPKLSPSSWFRSEVRNGEEILYRFAYHHGRVTHLMEVRDGHGYCARFEHAPLRGDSSKLLLRAISLEGPKRVMLGRMQCTYALHPSASGHEALLQSVSVRETAEESARSHQGFLEYYPARRNRPWLLKALHFRPQPAHLFVPKSLLRQGDVFPHDACHPPAPDRTGVRVWHEDSLTLIAEQYESSGTPATRFTLYARSVEPAVEQCSIRHCLGDLDAATGKFAGDHVLVALPNQLTPGHFEVLLWQWEPSSRGWVSFRRTLEAASLVFLEPTPDGLGLQVVREADPHTSYQFHWFDQPKAWSLTSMAPSAGKNELAAGQECRSPECEQEALFGRRSLPVQNRDSAEPCLGAEDSIHWQPGELFAQQEEGRGLALIS